MSTSDHINQLNNQEFSKWPKYQKLLLGLLDTGRQIESVQKIVKKMISRKGVLSR